MKIKYKNKNSKKNEKKQNNFITKQKTNESKIGSEGHYVNWEWWSQRS